MLQRIQDFLFKPISIASLVFFRIAFGVLLIAEYVGVLITSYFKEAYVEPVFYFKYWGLYWVKDLPEPVMFGMCLLAILLGIFVVLGFKYRLAMLGVGIIHAYFFLLDEAQYLNHGYLMVVLCFMMVLLPAHKTFSIDAWKRPTIRSKTIPYWPIFLLCFSMGVVYFYGGLAKINPDWLRAMPVKLWLQHRGDYWLVGPILKLEATAWFVAYGGLLLDLTVVFFLLFKRTRPYAYLAVVFFHISNTIIFAIGVFPWLSLALTSLFFAPNWPLKLLNRTWPVRAINRFKQTLYELRYGASTVEVQEILPQPKRKPWITALIGVYVCYMLLMPLRHHLYPGWVAWTEEGHRFSWRMMLRTKDSSLRYEITNLDNGQKFSVYPSTHLTPKQSRKMATFPDMIWQFAHYLDELYEKEGMPNIEVRAIGVVKLNDRPFYPFTDPEVDLLKVKYSPFKKQQWIKPLPE